MIPQEADQTHIEYGFPVLKLEDTKTFQDHKENVQFVMQMKLGMNFIT